MKSDVNCQVTYQSTGMLLRNLLPYQNDGVLTAHSILQALRCRRAQTSAVTLRAMAHKLILSTFCGQHLRSHIKISEKLRR